MCVNESVIMLFLLELWLSNLFGASQRFMLMYRYIINSEPLHLAEETASVLSSYLGPISRTSRKLFGFEKPFQKPCLSSAF